MKYMVRYNCSNIQVNYANCILERNLLNCNDYANYTSSLQTVLHTGLHKQCRDIKHTVHLVLKQTGSSILCQYSMQFLHIPHKLEKTTQLRGVLTGLKPPHVRPT